MTWVLAPACLVSNVTLGKNLTPQTLGFLFKELPVTALRILIGSFGESSELSNGKCFENIVLSVKGMFLYFKKVKPVGNPRGEKSASWG